MHFKILKNTKPTEISSSHLTLFLTFLFRLSLRDLIPARTYYYEPYYPEASTYDSLILENILCTVTEFWKAFQIKKINEKRGKLPSHHERDAVKPHETKLIAWIRLCLKASSHFRCGSIILSIFQVKPTKIHFKNCASNGNILNTKPTEIPSTQLISSRSRHRRPENCVIFYSSVSLKTRRCRH